MRTKESHPHRNFTDAELGAIVKAYREMRKWSQEQLAEIAGLSPRTIQRIERGHASGLDTRRAIARAFDFDDIDILSKPLYIPTDDEIAEARKQFDAEHVTLDAVPMASGTQLVTAVTSSVMDLSISAFDMEESAKVAFASLVDEFRDFRDLVDLGTCPEVEKVNAAREFQQRLAELSGLGVTLCYALRQFSIEADPDRGGRPLNATGLYLIAFPKGKEPKTLCVARRLSVGV